MTKPNRTLRSFSHLTALAILLGVASAGAAEAKLKVVTSLQDFASIAAAVGGDRVEAFALAKGYQDPHFVDAKPSFVLQLSRADLMIVAGLELEAGYLPPLVTQSRNTKIQSNGRGYLDASVGCEILQRPTQQVTRAMGDVHPYGNPHYWTDPENGRVIARAIAARLAELDPGGQGRLRARSRGVRDQARRQGEGVGRQDGSLRRHQGGHVPQLVAQLRQALQARRQRAHRAQAGHPADADPHARDHRPDPEREDPAHPGRALLRHQDAEVHRREDAAPRCSRSIRRSAARAQITDYFALFDTNIDALVAALGGHA